MSKGSGQDRPGNRPVGRSQALRGYSPADPTREQEQALGRLALVYDRIAVYGSVGTDLYVSCERVTGEVSYCLCNLRIDVDGRDYPA